MHLQPDQVLLTRSLRCGHARVPSHEWCAHILADTLYSSTVALLGHCICISHREVIGSLKNSMSESPAFNGLILHIYFVLLI